MLMYNPEFNDVAIKDRIRTPGNLNMDLYRITAGYIFDSLNVCGNCFVNM